MSPTSKRWVPTGMEIQNPLIFKPTHAPRITKFTPEISTRQARQTTIDMASHLDSFTCFGSLPVELQLKVWREALSTWCVLKAQPHVRENCESVTQHQCIVETTLAVTRRSRPPTSWPTGSPNLHLIAMSRKTARHLLEQICTPVCLSSSRPTVFWLNLDTTILYIGDQSMIATNKFSASRDLWSIKHVAFPWHLRRYTTVAISCSVMAKNSEDLRTVIIQQCVQDKPMLPMHGAGPSHSRPLCGRFSPRFWASAHGWDDWYVLPAVNYHGWIRGQSAETSHSTSRSTCREWAMVV